MEPQPLNLTHCVSCPGMSASYMSDTLDDALMFTGLDQVKVRHKPRLLSDNGPIYISGDLAEYMRVNGMSHTRGRPYHPQTLSKIERWHRSMKNVVKLDTYYYPWELEHAIAGFVHYYNTERYHESLNNLTPADVYTGRGQTVLNRRRRIKQKTLAERRRLYYRQKAA